MATIALMIKVEENHLADVLQHAREKLNGTNGELVMDFSSVRRIDPASLDALQDLASAAEAKAVKLVLRGIPVDVYKVLKLVKLTSKFSFTS